MSERQRVWRACQPCRKKKIKCDGQQPCQTCCRTKINCVYADPPDHLREFDSQYVSKLESKIQAMETQLRELYEKQIGNARESSSDLLPSDAHTSRQELQSPRNCPANHMPSDHGPRDAGTSMTDREQERNPVIPTASPQQRPQRTLDSREVPRPSGIINTQATATEADCCILWPIGQSNSVPMESLALMESTPLPEPLASGRIGNLPESLARALIDYFFEAIFPIFPIISEHEFRKQYINYDTSFHDRKTGFSSLLCALLAVSAPHLQPDHSVFSEPDVRLYQSLDLGSLLYSHAIADKSANPVFSPGDNESMSGIHLVIAQGLLSLYLAERGNVNDAWMTVGHAIRLYQILNVEDLMATEGTHGCLRWCLYILDRSLSTALLKPLAIDDVDFNLDDAREGDPWFSVIANFHITLGRVYKATRPLKTCYKFHNSKFVDELQSSIQRHDSELEYYFNRRVLPKVGSTSSVGRNIGLQNIAISSYHIGLLLLYRQFIENSGLATATAYLRCAEAASNCINFAPELIATVPVSHFVIQQYRALYVSTNVLLHCMRFARHMNFTNQAWPDVERGLEMLRNQKIQWPEIKKYRLLTESNMERTRADLNKHELVQRVFDTYTAKHSNLQSLSGHQGERPDHPSHRWETTDVNGFNERHSTAEKRSFSDGRDLTDNSDSIVESLGSVNGNGNDTNLPSKRRKTSYQVNVSVADEPSFGIDRNLTISKENGDITCFLNPEIESSFLDIEPSELFLDSFLTSEFGSYITPMDE